MDSLNGREVSVLRMHDIIHINNAGQLGPTIELTPGLRDKVIGLKMVYIDTGVLCTGASKGGQKFEVLIPATMCKSIQFAIG